MLNRHKLIHSEDELTHSNEGTTRVCNTTNKSYNKGRVNDTENFTDAKRRKI